MFLLGEDHLLGSFTRFLADEDTQVADASRLPQVAPKIAKSDLLCKALEIGDPVEFNRPSNLGRQLVKGRNGAGNTMVDLCQPGGGSHDGWQSKGGAKAQNSNTRPLRPIAPHTVSW